jgi:biotin carboxyl carrier protein
VETPGPAGRVALKADATQTVHQMQIDIEINGRSRRVVIEPVGAQYRVTVDGRTHMVDLAPVDDWTFSMVLDGEGVSHEVGLAETGLPNQLAVHVLGGSVDVRLAPRPGGRGRETGDHAGADGVQDVLAPMPGKVIRVLVAAGDQVKARQGLVVVEAMKMENELRSPKEGRVREVRVQEGMSVEAGRLLVVVE